MEASGRRHLGGIWEEASGRRYLRGASARRHLEGGIWEQASGRRHLEGGIWEDASGGRHLGGPWEGPSECSGGSGGIWEKASGRRHLGFCWDSAEASWETLEEALGSFREGSGKVHFLARRREDKSREEKRGILGGLWKRLWEGSGKALGGLWEGSGRSFGVQGAPRVSERASLQ